MGLLELLGSIRNLSLEAVSYCRADAPEESERNMTDISTLCENQQLESISYFEIPSSSASSSSSFNVAGDDRQTSNQSSKQKDQSADRNSQTESRNDVYYTLIQKQISQKTPLSQLVVLKSATQEARIRRTLQGDGGNEGDWYDATCQERWISIHIHQITWGDPFTSRHSCLGS